MRQQNGFTLIELLVVIAIIGILSAVVLASLSTTRGKSKDAAIKAEIGELRTVMDFNFADYGSYTNLSPAMWITSQSPTCAAYPVTGNYAAQFKNICTAIMVNAGNGINTFFSGVNASLPGANVTTYSLMVWLPGAQTYWCAGSSGAASTNTGTWTSPGCFSNP